MTESGLATKVLKDVSRSFYLSLRALPEGFREPASLGYLLARLSDTIADAGDTSVEQRVELLTAFREALSTGDREWLIGLSSLNDVSEGERKLIERAADCFDVLEDFPLWQKKAVLKAVDTITVGQSWDLTRFEGDGVVKLKDEGELRQYTYWVAGCVGEFWTELGFGLGDFSSEPREQMDEWARDYGRSLQLINILRDVHEDLKIGRCYLPEDDLLEARQKWIKVAREGLKSAEHYCQALHGRRMRFATWLPALIGEETLDLLENSSEEAWKERVKVKRSDVRRLMGVALKKSLWG